MRHFDVQMIGGMTLHRGRIAEMKTGEGKTLVATLSVYLNALTRKGVRVVTVMTTSPAVMRWMRPLYEFLGLTVALSLQGRPAKRSAVLISATLPTAPTTSLALTIFATTWRSRWKIKSSSLHYAIVDKSTPS